MATFGLAACGSGGDRGPINVAVIGEEEAPFQRGVRLSAAAQHLRAATNEGLVGLDPAGQIIPAIAERWIVTDDGLSYIFRLRDTTWPDGEALTAAEVRLLFRESLRQLDGTSLGLDLAKVTEVRAMTGRVIEVRLSSPMPEFLRLLAQPELGLVQNGSGVGPMTMTRNEEGLIAELNAMPPEMRGLPARDGWEDAARDMSLRALAGPAAVEAFSSGLVDLVLNGDISTFPLAQLGPLSRGNVQVDPAQGLFGFMIRNDDGVLSDPILREALSMAIDRSELIEPFGLDGWRPTTWIVPQESFSPLQYPATRWSGRSIEERRAAAQQRIASWVAQNGTAPSVSVGLPEGPGSDLLFEQVSIAWEGVGLSVERLAMDEGADIELRDRMARYSSPRWFLNQFNCSLEIGLCSPETDTLVRESLTQKDSKLKQALLADAHSELVAAEVFIPLGVPVRWSLVRGAVTGYQANPWGLHPLFPLVEPTI